MGTVRSTTRILGFPDQPLFTPEAFYFFIYFEFRKTYVVQELLQIVLVDPTFSNLRINFNN